MKSKFTEAFDSLGSDDKTKEERTERVMAEYNDAGFATPPAAQKSKYAMKTRIFSGKRGVALIVAIVVFITTVGILVPVGINFLSNRGLLYAMSQLKNTFVDMEGVSAFGVWNAPDSSSKSAYISDVMSIRQSSFTEETDGEEADGEETDGGETDGEGEETSTGDWSDEERYDWESDYDWDPTKANVLIAIGEDGSITEVVYERTNGRGQVRQDVLGNAAMVYVSNGFTYIMYVDDDEWEFWKQIEYAQRMRSPGGFSCHHEKMQTVVIHNETGKVFALNDIFPQVNEHSGAVNHTLQADPLKDDILHIKPMYGNYKNQWYNVRFDEATQTIRYELVIDRELVADRSYNVFAVKRDKYGQQYLLARSMQYGQERVGAGIVNLPKYSTHGNSLIFDVRNGFYLGSDGQVYAFDDGMLKVFGDEFSLTPVSPDAEVAFEGMVDMYTNDSSVSTGSGISYTLKNGYLFSMFGEVWKVGDDGSLSARDRLEGSFPRYANDGHLIGGEIIAFVDTKPLSLLFDDQYSVNGRMVQIKFDGYTESSPDAKFIHIISASEMSYYSARMIVEQNENPLSLTRGDTKYFLITVVDGIPIVEYVAYGYDGRMYGLVNPITEPLVQT